MSARPKRGPYRKDARKRVREERAAQERAQAVAERDYWQAWAALIGLGWKLYGWSYFASAEFILPDSRSVHVSSDHIAAFEALAGNRAPKRPEVRS